MSWRVAFVGQETYFGVCAQRAPSRELEPLFVDHRVGHDPERMLAAVRAHRPDAVVVFRPEIVPPGLFAGLDALTLGWNTEPLPRGDNGHPDLAWRLSELAGTDTSNFDRIVTFDPLSAAAAVEAGVPIWRAVPLPVDDRVFAEVRPMPARPRVVFIGYSTEHRERWLIDSKHRFDVLHVAHGLHGDRLLDLLGRTDIAINLHGEPYPTFENRVCLHLAAGHLLLSEPLSPLHGLEPGIDFLEVVDPKHLEWAIEGLLLRPPGRSAVRVRGRRKAEHFRASRVYPRLVSDLAADVAAFGSQRR